ncbi:hypothetical protein FCV25MIE_17446 [Fagus crenata]
MAPKKKKIQHMLEKFIALEHQIQGKEAVVQSIQVEIEENKAELAAVVGKITNYEKVLCSSETEVDAVCRLKNEFRFAGLCKIVKSSVSRKRYRYLVQYAKSQKLQVDTQEDA